MLSVSPGHHWRYLVDQVGKGAENYYTKAVDRGEPPGMWHGDGAVQLGLSGEVAEAQMEALYGHFIDPRDPLFDHRELWDMATRLGSPPRRFRSNIEILAALLAAEPDATPERVEQLRAAAQQQRRNAVAFIDLTFSVQKSVSVLHTALRAQEADADRAGDTGAAHLWRSRAEAVERAIWAGNTAMLDYLQREAGFSRIGYHGPRQPGRDSVGRYVDAHRWVVASFFQHTSRPTAEVGEQPNLHIHNAVLNRVQCPDGAWRTLDSRAIHRARGAAAALAERVMEEQLTQTIGVEFVLRPDGRSREVVGVPEKARDWFSARRRAITTRTAQYAQLWRDRLGRDPNPLELSRLAQRATVDTRQSKLHRPTDAAARVVRWAAELRREVDQTMAAVADASIGRVWDASAAAGRFDPDDVVVRAVADVQATKSAWTRYDLLRAINTHLPDCLGGLTAGQIEQLRERLADQALRPDPDRVGGPAEVWRLTAPELVAVPAELRRADGTSLYTPHGADLYATRQHLDTEERLEAAAEQARGAPAVEPEAARTMLAELSQRLAADGGQLGQDQATALYGILTSGRPVETLIGPAGAGKSFTLGTLAGLWEDHLGGRVVGLALAQRASAVLAAEGIGQTANIARWLGVQASIEDGRAGERERDRWRLRRNDLVVVDEAGMADTGSLAEVQRRGQIAGAKILFVGDPRQLSAVGAGGAFRLVADAGAAYQLDEVRRFRSPWERAASLRLRAGDPTVLPLYERHGRLVDAGTVQNAGKMAASGWLADTLAGKQSLILVDTNDQAAALSAYAQTELVRLGRTAEPNIDLADGNRAGVGDLIQARRNDRSIRSSNGTWVVNRRTYQVTATRPDGSMAVQAVPDRRRDGPQAGSADLVLPAEYVRQHTTLAYATTVHGAQGQTVDTCHAAISAYTGGDAVYVGLTRGRQRNTAYVATGDGPDLPVPGGPDPTPEEPATPVQALAGILERHEPDRAALTVIREDLDDASSLRRLGAIWTDIQQQTTVRRYESIARELLPAATAERVVGDDAAGPLWRVLHAAELAGHDPRTVLKAAIVERELTTAGSMAKVLHWRVVSRCGQTLIPRKDTYLARTHVGDSPLHRYGRNLAEAMDARADALGAAAADHPPPWLQAHLGRVPTDVYGRIEWTVRAGRVMAYREQYGYDSDRDAIGLAPAAGRSEARAAWYAAWRALGEPDTRPDEATQPVARLYATLAAYARKEASAPPWVGDELREVVAAADHARQRAILSAAEAHVETDPQRRRQLHHAAATQTAYARQLLSQQKHLESVDETRADWYARTAEVRAAADRAHAELRRREAGGRVTAQPDPTDRVAPAQPALYVVTLASRANRSRQLAEQLYAVSQARRVLQQQATAAHTRSMNPAAQGRDATNDPEQPSKSGDHEASL